jgi:hypothetical protein
MIVNVQLMPQILHDTQSRFVTSLGLSAMLMMRLGANLRALTESSLPQER